MRFQFCIQKVPLQRNDTAPCLTCTPTDALLEVNCPRAPALAAFLRTDVVEVDGLSGTDLDAARLRVAALKKCDD